MSSLLVVISLLSILFSGVSTAQGDVANTVHNLSATGPGPIKAPAVRGGELCVFCHTPHSASGTRASWNRDLPPITYNLYTSSTMSELP